MQPPAPAQAPAEVAIAELEVANPSDFERRDTGVYLSYYDLGLGLGQGPAPHVVVRAADAVLPSQAVDSDGDSAPDGVLLLVDLAPAESKTLTLVSEAGSPQEFPKRTQAQISHKVGGQWRPREKEPNLQEYVGGSFQNVQRLTSPPQNTDHSFFIRYEGPGIESDKVGYRIYLDWRNGFDIFGKKVDRPVLQDVGLDGYESYHHMSDWGMDLLKVGESLGTGAFGFWNGKRVELVSKVREWEAAITNNGSSYSSFRIAYKGWQIHNKTVDLSADFSMTAGSRMVQTRLRLSDGLPNLAVGIVKHPGTEAVQGPTNITGQAYTYLGSWGKQSLNDDLLGMAVLFKKGALASQPTDPQNYVAVVTPSGSRFDYYFLAAWSGEPGGVKTKEEFVRYLDQETEKLTLAPRVRLETALSKAAKAIPIRAEAALGWSKKLADSELERKTLSYRYDGWDEFRQRKPEFEYDIVGLLPLAYDELNAVAPDPKYGQVIEQVTGSYVTDDGRILAYREGDYNIDAVLPGRVLLRLYDRTRHDKYKTAAGVLRRQLRKHPRTSEGAFWHKKRYPWQLWLDGVYMGMPFLAEYSARFENNQSLDEVVTEFTVARTRLRNGETGLYAHAWDEKKKQDWADPRTGLSKHAWGRGLGWFAMALLDVLDAIGENDIAHRRPLIDMVRELAPALVKHQDAATHTWWQILDMPRALGNYREATASAMFTYFFAKAARKGYLDSSYRAVALQSYQGLVGQFVRVHPDGKISLTNGCLVGGLGYGRDGSYRYYMSEPVVNNDPKGTGPFILAGIEVYRLLQQGG